MEVRHRILQFNNSPKYEQLRKELDRLGWPYEITILGSSGDEPFSSIECLISENDPLFPTISELIRKYDFYVQVGVYYSDEDIEAADWVYASVGEFQYPQPEDGCWEAATYDISRYCLRCGMGAVQMRPFRLRRDFRQKSSRFLGLHWVFDEIFVRPVVKTIFERDGISGVGFCHPVHHKSGEPIDSVYQMVVQTIAEPGLVTEGLSTVTCKPNNEESYMEGIGRIPNRRGDYPYCGLVKYHHPERDAIKFRREALIHLPDIAKSHEYFGSGGAAHRLILMRKRVVEYVETRKLRGLGFTPIELV
jgi:hypothetical protein